jgi:tetratricopeptide (TPR) repeat protein
MTIQNSAALTLTSLFIIAVACKSGDPLSRQWETCSSAGSSPARLTACTKIIEAKGLGTARLSIAYADRASYYLAAHQPQKAASDAERATQLDLLDSFAFRVKADADDQLGNHQQAIDDASSAIILNKTLKKEDAISYLTRGRAYRSLNQLDNAVLDFDTAIKLGDAATRSSALSARGQIYSLKEQQPLAVQDFDAALQADPTNYFALFWRGISHLIDARDFNRPGDYTLALHDFDTVLKQNPNLANALFERGAIKRETGDTQGGDFDIQRARQIDPNVQELLVDHNAAKVSRVALNTLPFTSTTAETPVPSELPSSFTGQWHCQGNPMPTVGAGSISLTLNQAGNEVSGSFAPDSGNYISLFPRINGTIIGSSFSGRFSSSLADQKGVLHLDLLANSSLTGTYQTDGSATVGTLNCSPHK